MCLRPATVLNLSDGLRPLQTPHLWYSSSLCAARKLACLDDRSALSALRSLGTVPESGSLQRSLPRERLICVP
nr:signal peptidase [Neisseria weixii]